MILSRTHQLLFALVALVSLTACPPDTEIVEPISFGDYHVVNLTSVPVRIEAAALFTRDPISLLVERVEPGDSAHIYTFVEGSGGHVFPSNAFAKFTVSATINGTPTVIYSAVDDNRWQPNGNTEDGHFILEFSVTDEDIETAGP